MTRSRVHPFLLTLALLSALGLAVWQSQRAAAALRARALAERELHASESLLETAKRNAAAAEQRKAEVTKAIEARQARPFIDRSRTASPRPLSASALVRQQTADSLRSRPEIMAAAHEAAVRRVRWQYGPLIARLGLNAAQAAQFEALLVQRDGIAIDNYQLQPVEPQQQGATDDALRQLLGDGGYAQFTDYANTLGMRVNVTRLAANLSQVEPLSPDVAGKLVQAGAAAVQRRVAEMRQSGAAVSSYFPDELLLPAAQSLLTPRQFETFKLMVEQETGRKAGGS